MKLFAADWLGVGCETGSPLFFGSTSRLPVGGVNGDHPGRGDSLGLVVSPYSSLLLVGSHWALDDIRAKQTCSRPPGLQIERQTPPLRVVPVTTGVQVATGDHLFDV